MTAGRTNSPPNGTVSAKSKTEQLSAVYLGHDLRAALAEMMAGIKQLQDLDLPDSAKQHLKGFVATGNRLGRMIDQSVLACLGQGPAGSTSPVTIGTADFLDNLVARWKGLYSQSGHVFELHAAPTLPTTLQVDATAVDRMLTNLLTNAMLHTPPGKVTLSFAVSAAEDRLHITIQDQGPGLPPALLLALRTEGPLAQGVSPLDKGIGLSAVRHLIETMGGTYQFSNAAQGGLVTEIHLPLLALPIPDPRPTSALARPANLAGRSLLLGEDNQTYRNLMAGRFRRLGAMVTAVESGAGVIEHLSQGMQPDLLLLDDQMPGLSGLDVLQWVRETLAKAERPPILILTAYVGPDRAQALMAAGATRVEIKDGYEVDRIAQLLQDGQMTPPLQPDPKALDLSILRHLTEIAGPLAAAELLARLDEDLHQTRQGLWQAVANIDLDGIRQHSHVLIALAGTAGATELHDGAVKLNGLVHAAAPKEQILALATSLEQGILDLQFAVQAMAATAPQERPTP